jgi:hypothetical protein
MTKEGKTPKRSIAALLKGGKEFLMRSGRDRIRISFSVPSFHSTFPLATLRTHDGFSLTSQGLNVIVSLDFRDD